MYSILYTVYTVWYAVCYVDRTDKEVGSNDTAHDGFIWSMAWHPMGHILVTGIIYNKCNIDVYV